jgi:outer membrane protein
VKFALLSLVLAVSAGAQELTLADAVAMALSRNPDLIVERESLHIAEASLLRAESAYDPALRGDARLRRRTDPVNSILSGAPPGELAPTTRTLQTSASLITLLPTGATVSLSSGLAYDRTNSVLALLTPAWSTAFGAEVRQPLLQNRRIDPARRAIRIARVDRSRAVSSLRRTATEITASVERAWWTLAAARRDVLTRQSALRVAEQQRDDTRIRIEAGTQPEADLAQTIAEVERRRAEVSVARENETRAANTLSVLTGADLVSGPAPAFAADAQALVSPRTMSETEAIASALAHRPELDELAHRLDRQDVEIEAARDRVLPQVDLVAAYNGRGLGGTTNEDAIQPFGPVVVPGDLRGGLGTSLENLAGNEFPDASLGLAVTIPLGNAAARQDVAIARAQRRQAEAALEGARQRVALEVRNALAAKRSAEERVEATRAAREAAEVQLQAERDRFEGGTSNTFFILTRQNDLAAAQLAETVALTDLRRAETELARATGTLLSARGIEIEGDIE